MSRIGIIALQHEANTFVTKGTTRADFEADGVLVGDQIVQRYGPSHHEVGGFIEWLSAGGAIVVPIFATRATPGGTVEAASYQSLLDQMLSELRRALPLDGLLVAPHGAAVSEDQPDMDGHWLSKVRDEVGRDMPIICTLDLHANLSQRMVDACNATIAYRSNPHLDQRDRGIDAARLIVRTVAGEVRPTQAAAFPPIAINIERQLTSHAPCKELFALADEQLRRPRVLGNSVLLGFPYADVPEMGSSFIAVTDNDPALARQLSDELATHLLHHRREFVPELISIERSLDLAMQQPSPVCLLDIGDNVGGGAPGDGTVIIHEIHRRKIGPAVASLYDPRAVQEVTRAGAGVKLELTVGGKIDPRHGPPLTAMFQVRGLYDGKFSEPHPRHGGRVGYDMGPSAVIETEHGLTLALNSRRTPPFSLGQITSCGLEPAKFRIAVAKGVHAPVAAYSTFCKSFIRVNTPGVTTADMTRLQYRHRRRPLFPLEEI